MRSAPLALIAPVAAIALGAPTSLAPLIILTALIGGIGYAVWTVERERAKRDA